MNSEKPEQSRSIADAATLLTYQAASIEKVRRVLIMRGASRAGVEVADDSRARIEAIEAELAQIEAISALPFATTCEALGLDRFERDSLITIVAPHLDVEFREAIGHFWGQPARRHVDAALLLALLLDGDQARFAALKRLREGSRLHAAGLIETSSINLGIASTQLEQELVPTPRLLRLFEGSFGLDPRYSGLAQLLATDATAAIGVLTSDHLRKFHDLITSAQKVLRPGPAVVMFAGPRGGGKVRAARALASIDAAHILVVESSQLPLEAARLSKSMRGLAHEAELLSARLVLRRVDAYAIDSKSGANLRHAIATCPFPIWLTSDVDPARVDASNLTDLAQLRFSIGLPDHAARRAAWRAELQAYGQTAPLDDDVLDQLASDYPLTRSAIEVAARLSVSAAGRSSLEEALPKIAATQLHGELERFAKRGRSAVRVRDVVLPDNTREQVDELVAALRRRNTVMNDWGLAERHAIGRGIVALFNGPPGTGKTLTASAIANELELPLYRIDASSIVDRYVGETEKNLVRLFDEASASRAALLFDEADSLFGKRLEAKDSTDRYANLQINMLLNLIEDYDGFVVLTTNLKGALDDAFLRRIIYKIVFDKPEQDELVALWEYHLPNSIQRADDVDIEALVDEFDQLAGGDVKNAVLRATLSCPSDKPINQAALRRAVINELRANGKVIAG